MRSGALLLTLLFAANARAETIVVNLTTDAPDADPNDGTADTDLSTDGLQVTLRSALQHANAHAGRDEIRFSEDLGAAPVVTPAALPAITEDITVDGSVPGGRVELGAGLVLRAPEVSISNLMLSDAPEDALVAEVPGALTLSSVDVVGATGWAVKSAGDLDLTDCLISTNGSGGLLALGAVTGTGLAVESNGGPGVVAKAGIGVEGSQIRGNGGPGLYTSGPVTLEGDTVVNGNVGYGIWAGKEVTAGGSLEIQDNASWGIRAGLDVDLGPSAVVSNDGHGSSMQIPEGEIALDLTFATRDGEEVRGGGVVSLDGRVSGGQVVANDNAGPALLAAGDVLLGPVTLLRNDGPGIQSLGTVSFDGGQVEANLGIGVTAAGDVTSSRAVQMERNASAAVSGAVVTVGSSEMRSTIAENGRGERVTFAMLDEAPILLDAEPRTTAVVATSFTGVFIDVVKSGGDGISAGDVSLTDAGITDNLGAGVRASGRVTLVRTLLCDNAKGDLVGGQDVTLTESAACDQRSGRVRAPGGCGCDATGAGAPPWGLVWFLPLLRLLRRR